MSWMLSFLFFLVLLNLLFPSLSSYEIVSYVFTLITGFFLLCFMLKLQPYQSRHHLSLFVLFSALVGVSFSQTINRHLITALAIVLIVTSFPFVFENKFRPIASGKNIFNTPRNELYFSNRPYLASSYINAVNFIKKQNCNEIGLSLGVEARPSNSNWEYPFLIFLRQDNKEKIYFQHILHSDNTSSQFLKDLPYKEFTPCAIIATRNSKQKPPEKIVVNQTTYISKWFEKPVSVLLKQ